MRLLAALLLASAALAQAQKTPTQDAPLFAKAHKAGDRAAMRAFLDRPNPWPWFLADALIGLKEFEAAKALAVMAGGKEHEKLPGYIEAQRSRPDRPDVRKAVDIARAHWKAGRPKQVLAVLAKLSTEPADISSVRIHYMRGGALQDLGRLDEAERGLRATIKAADRIGYEGIRVFAVERLAQIAERRDGLAAAIPILEKLWQRVKAFESSSKKAWVLTHTAQLMVRLGRWEQALALFRRAIPFSDPLGAAGCRYSCGIALINLGRPREAEKPLRKALGFLSRHGPAVTAAEVQGVLASILVEDGRHKEGERLATAAFGVLLKAGRKQAATAALYRIAAARFKAGDLARAGQLYGRALVGFRAVGSAWGVVNCLIGLANVENGRGREADALRHYEAALAADNRAPRPLVQARLLRSCGNTEIRLGRLDAAEARLEKALAVARKCGAAEVEGHCLEGLSRIELAHGRTKKARELLDSARAIALRLGDQRLLASVEWTLSDLHGRAGDSEAMIEAARRGIEGFVKTGQPLKAVQLLGNLTGTYLELKRHKDALRTAERAVALARSIRDLSTRANTNFIHGAALVEVGRFKQALEVAKKALASRYLSDAKKQTDLHLMAGRALHGLGRHRKALGHLLDAAQAAERAGLKDKVSFAAGMAMNVTATLRDGDERLRVARLSQQRARRMKDPKAELEARHWEGTALNMQGAQKEAERVLIEVRDEAERSGDRKLLGETLVSLGNVSTDTRDWAHGRRCYERGLAILRETGKRSAIAHALVSLAGLETFLGDQAAAEKLYRELETIAEESDADFLRAKAHDGLGRVHFNRSEYKQAERRYLAAHKIWAGLHFRREVARCLNRIGLVYDRRGNPKAAMPYFEKALRLLEGASDPVLRSHVLNNHSVTLMAAGRLAEAEKILRGLIESGEREGDPTGVRDAQRGLALLCQRRGDLKGAYAGFAASLAACERAGDPPLLVVYRHIELASAATKLHRFEEAEDQLGRARAAAEGDPYWTAKVLNGIGKLRNNEGDFDAAMAAHQQARRLCVEFGLKAEKLVSEGWMAQVHQVRGRFAAAAELQRNGLAAFEEWGDPFNAAMARTNLAMSLRSLGRLPEAIALLERAAEVFEKLGSRLALTRSCRRLGILHDEMGDYAAAIRYEQRALAICREIGYRRGEAISQANLASWALNQGNVEEGLSALERSIELYRELGLEGGLATSIGNLAAAYDRRGDHRRARRLFEEALAINRRIGRKQSIAALLAKLGADKCLRDNQPDEGLALCREALALAEEVRSPREILKALENLALVRLLRREPAEALAAARRGIQIAQGLTRGLSDEHAAMARSERFEIADLGVIAASRLGRFDDFVFFLESARAGGLLEALGGRKRVSGHLLPPELLRAELAAQARERGAQKALEQATRAKKRRAIKAARRELAAAHDAVREVVARIQRSQKAAAGVLYPKPATLAEIQAALRPGEGYVAYARLARVKGWVALVLTRDRREFCDLGPIAPLEKACAAFDLRGPDRKADPAELVRLLIEPLGLGPEVQRLLISADGVLAEVPFVLLTDREVVSVPSATTWLRLREQARGSSDAILAVGDPDYSGTKLAALPATRAEAKAIGEVVLLGKQATPANLIEALGRKKRWRAVHLACHGLLDTERPTRSALALTAGRLTVLDVFRMKIPADLVTLSACETARGKHFRAEGVMGLPRAFMLAGAPRAIVSLWKVDDEATRALMVKFYGLWETLPAATALKKAQEFVRGHDKWKHPYFWAAWQLWGLAE